MRAPRGARGLAGAVIAGAARRARRRRGRDGRRPVASRARDSRAWCSPCSRDPPASRSAAGASRRRDSAAGRCGAGSPRASLRRSRGRSAPARDPLSGFFATRRAELLALGEAPQGFKILLELLAHGGSRLRVTEVPIVFVDRAYGQSKLGLGTARQYLAGSRRSRAAELDSPRVRRLRAALAVGALVDALVFALLAAAGREARHRAARGRRGGAARAAALCARDLSAARELRRARRAPWLRLAGLALLAALLRGGVLGTLVRAGLRAASPRSCPRWPRVSRCSGSGRRSFVLRAGAARPSERALALRIGCIALAALPARAARRLRGRARAAARGGLLLELLAAPGAVLSRPSAARRLADRAGRRRSSAERVGRAPAGARLLARHRGLRRGAGRALARQDRRGRDPGAVLRRCRSSSRAAC